MLVIEAPHRPKIDLNSFSVFLAGSIEMGVAERWQDRLIHMLEHSVESKVEGEPDLIIYNPRRLDWDSTWEQTIDCKPFREQVTWELDHLIASDLKIFYFDPNTKSPITLMELGLCANDQDCLVCCPPGFWRKGNIDIVCHLYELEKCLKLETVCGYIAARYNEYIQKVREYK